uniref:TIP41-like protein n=1 Tax=Ascaris lumbricoides TaxID=6252 RepID=A0A0M3I6G6_ASCLU
MKAPMRALLTVTNDDVVFEDRIFNYNFVGKSKLSAHIAKVRAYYRYLSPYNKVEASFFDFFELVYFCWGTYPRLGSCIYEGEDVIVVLWRLSSLRSSFLSYLPKLFTKREDKMDVVEGAMDVHVTKDGQIYKIVNRKITASDLEGAKVMAEMKKEIDEESLKKERRKWIRELDDMMEKEATR